MVQDYLKNRQVTQEEDYIYAASTGVSKGSILGPLL